MRGGLFSDLQPNEAPTEQEFTDEPKEPEPELGFRDAIVNSLIIKLSERNKEITDILNRVKIIDKEVIVKLDVMRISMHRIRFIYYNIANEDINLFISIINNLNKNKNYELNGINLYEYIGLDF